MWLRKNIKVAARFAGHEGTAAMFTRFSSWRSVTWFYLSLALMCSSTGASDFFEVCRTGTPQQVIALVEAGADVNAKDLVATHR
jgi:hypothetical protein